MVTSGQSFREGPFLIDEDFTNDIILDSQVAKRTADSAQHALLALKTDVILGIIGKVPTIACLFDIKKASD